MRKRESRETSIAKMGNRIVSSDIEVTAMTKRVETKMGVKISIKKMMQKKKSTRESILSKKEKKRLNKNMREKRKKIKIKNREPLDYLFYEIHIFHKIEY